MIAEPSICLDSQAALDNGQIPPVVATQGPDEKDLLCSKLP